MIPQEEIYNVLQTLYPHETQCLPVQGLSLIALNAALTKTERLIELLKVTQYLRGMCFLPSKGI